MYFLSNLFPLYFISISFCIQFLSRLYFLSIPFAFNLYFLSDSFVRWYFNWGKGLPQVGIAASIKKASFSFYHFPNFGNECFTSNTKEILYRKLESCLSAPEYIGKPIQKVSNLLLGPTMQRESYTKKWGFYILVPKYKGNPIQNEDFALWPQNTTEILDRKVRIQLCDHHSS